MLLRQSALDWCCSKLFSFYFRGAALHKYQGRAWAEMQADKAAGEYIGSWNRDDGARARE